VGDRLLTIQTDRGEQAFPIVGVSVDFDVQLGGLYARPGLSPLVER
jgi:hypothetical protein